MELTITGVIMCDADDNRRRNYESFVISAYVKTRFWRKETHVHICNYAISVKGVAHRMLSTEYSTQEKAMEAMTSKNKEKLARNRTERAKILDTFKTIKELQNFMMALGLKLTVENLKTFENHFTKFEEAAMKEDEIAASSKEEHFEKVIAKRLSGESLEELEEKSDFGKATSATNPNWGMF
jgi:hypothetical protein